MEQNNNDNDFLLVNGKPFYHSKLFYLGVLQLIISIISYVDSSSTMGTAMLLSGILTIILRFMTTGPVTMS